LLITAFGFRNLANYRPAWKILPHAEAGGELGILDFSEPGGSWQTYTLYSAGFCLLSVFDFWSSGPLR